MFQQLNGIWKASVKNKTDEKCRRIINEMIFFLTMYYEKVSLENYPVRLKSAAF